MDREMLALALITPLYAPCSNVVLAPRLTLDDKTPPRVVGLEPGNLADDVDAKKTAQLVVAFDRAMNPSTLSICGGGPMFPAVKGKPHWETPQKLVVDVELLPDHDYEMTLNCNAGKGFRSAEGVELAPLPWSFSTLPEKLPDAAEQAARNRKAFDELKSVLAESYSYFDLRVHDWSELYRAHEAELLGAKTTRCWARAAAKMLAPTEDLHLYLRFGDRSYATASSSVDSLYRAQFSRVYFSMEAAGAFPRGRTQDGVGYVMIPEWSPSTDIGAIEDALASLRDCRALVVDVRPNSGGDEALARRVAAWFVDGSKVYAKHRVREKAGKDGFGPIGERTIEGNTDAEKRITAPVAVLTSRNVMSSNESFVLMMRQAKDCTVVGESTHGSSGNPKPHRLSNDVTIFVPSWQNLRPDGTCFEGEGLKPDVEVKVDPKELETKDPIFERALAVLREKIKSAGVGPK